MSHIEDFLNESLDRKRAADEASKKKLEREARIERLIGPAQKLARLRDEEAVSTKHPFFKEVHKKKLKEQEAFVKAKKAEFAEKLEQIRESGPEGAEEAERLEKMKIFGSAFEYLIARRINVSGWFGTMRAKLTSEYDDYKNGIDLYIERDGKPLGLSFDVTFNKDSPVIAKKLKHIKTAIQDGALAELEHYLPLDPEKLQEAGTSDGYPIGLPKLVIGVSQDEMLTAIERYVQNGDAKPDAVHGIVVLYQMKFQLEQLVGHMEFLGSSHRGAMRLLPVYKRAFKEVNEIWNVKVAELKLTDAVAATYAKEDPFTKNLVSVLQQMFPTQ